MPDGVVLWRVYVTTSQVLNGGMSHSRAFLSELATFGNCCVVYVEEVEPMQQVEKLWQLLLGSFSSKMFQWFQKS